MGTLAGAVLSSLFLIYVHPPPVGLAALVLLFTWCCYSVLNVNYALFSLFITSYIVFLLSLNDMPGREIAERRFICTMVGGAIALSVRLIVLHHRRRQDCRSLQALGGNPSSLDKETTSPPAKT